MSRLGRPEVQALVVLVAGIVAIAVGPQRQAATAGTWAVAVFTVSALITLVFRPRFWRGVLITAGCWVPLYAMLIFVAAIRGPLPNDSFLSPALIMILGLPVAGLLRWLWLQRDAKVRFERRDLLRAEVQFVIALVVAAAGVFLVPRGAAILVSFGVVTAFTVAAPVSLAFRPTFFGNALAAFILWLILIIAVPQFANARRPMREDAMIFLFPAMLMLPLFVIGGIVHYFRRRRRIA